MKDPYRDSWMNPLNNLKESLNESWEESLKEAGEEFPMETRRKNRKMKSDNNWEIILENSQRNPQKVF